jgi:hypothetical protein
VRALPQGIEFTKISDEFLEIYDFRKGARKLYLG